MLLEPAENTPGQRTIVRPGLHHHPSSIAQALQPFSTLTGNEFSKKRGCAHTGIEIPCPAHDLAGALIVSNFGTVKRHFHKLDKWHRTSLEDALTQKLSNM